MPCCPRSAIPVFGFTGKLLVIISSSRLLLIPHHQEIMKRRSENGCNLLGIESGNQSDLRVGILARLLIV